MCHSGAIWQARLRGQVLMQEEAAEKRRKDTAAALEKRQRTAAEMAAENRRQLQLKVCIRPHPGVVEACHCY